jgi:glycosyltransferase involved in cell wall biosynthesis
VNVEQSSVRISVVTPTRNRVQLLGETIDSLQGQTLADWEHIIVDDGSSDGTEDAVMRRISKDPRIRFIKRPGPIAGANVCRNLGMRNSRSQLTVFLDSDDLLRPRCLERRVEIMDRNRDLDFAVFQAQLFRNLSGDMERIYHPQDPGDDLIRFLTIDCVWQTTGPVWRRGFLEAIGGFDETLLSLQDLELHVRAIAARAKYIRVHEVDHDIRCCDDGTSTSVRHFKDPKYIRAAESTPAKLFHTVTNSGLMTWSRQRALMGLVFGGAECWSRAGSLRAGLSAWNRGCSELHAPIHLRILGDAMLLAARINDGEEGVFYRLVNKCKGWVRFRQEPALLAQLDRQSK